MFIAKEHPKPQSPIGAAYPASRRSYGAPAWSPGFSRQGVAPLSPLDKSSDSGRSCVWPAKAGTPCAVRFYKHAAPGGAVQSLAEDD